MAKPQEQLLAELTSTATSSSLLEERAEFVSMVKMQQLVRVTCLEVMQSGPSQIEAYRQEVLQLQELVKGYLDEVRGARPPPSSPSTASLRSTSMPDSPAPLSLLEAYFEEPPQEQWYEHKPLPRFAVRVRTASGEDYAGDDLILAVSMLNGRGHEEEQRANGTGELLAGERTATVRNGVAEWSSLRVSEPSSKHYGSFTIVVRVHSAPEGVGIEELKSEPLTVQVGRMWSKRRKAESELGPDDPIAQIPGIGARYVSRLQLAGLATIGQFSAMAVTVSGRDRLNKLCRGDNPRNSLNAAKLQAMFDAANKVCRASATRESGGKRMRTDLSISASAATGSSPLPEGDEPSFSMEELLLLASPDAVDHVDFSDMPPTPSLAPLAPVFDRDCPSALGGSDLDDLEPRMRRMHVEQHGLADARSGASIDILPPKRVEAQGAAAQITILPPKHSNAGAASGFDALDALDSPSKPSAVAAPLVPSPPELALSLRAAWRGEALGDAAADRFGCTPLHLAALAGHAHLITDLAAHAPNLMPHLDAPAMAMGGATPLHLAACAGCDGEAAAHALLDLGASAGAMLRGSVSAAHLAAWSGAPSLLSRLFEMDGGMIDQPSDAGLTPLEYAALGGHAECVRMALQAGGRGGSTLPPLHCAALSEDEESIALLLEAHPEQLHSYSDAGGWLPLHAAASAAAIGAVRALLAAGADANAPTADGLTTPIDLACACGHADVCAELLNSGSRVPNGADPRTCPPLLCAAACGELECVRVLASTAASAGIGEISEVMGDMHLDAQLAAEIGALVR